MASASLGDTGILQDFIRELRTERAESANLNYWAYWIGELPDDQHDDSFMIDTDPRSWAGLQLAQHLTQRIQVDSPHLALNLHTLHTLVGSRMAMIAASPQLRERLGNTLERLHSSEGLDRQVRDELIGLTYAVRNAN